MIKLEHQIMLFCQDKLASIWRASGSYDKAERSFEKVVGEKTMALGKNHVLTFQSAANWASILRDRGDYKRALGIIQAHLGSEAQNFYQNISRVKLAGVLAKIFMDLGNLELALYVSRNVLSACEVLLGPDDAFTLDQASHLALVLSKLGEYRIAEIINQRVLDKLEEILGPNHLQSLSITNRLANNLRSQGRYKRAVELLTRTLKAQETRLESSHPETLSTKCGLAATYALQGRFSDSKILFLQVKRYLDRMSSEHPNRVWTEKALDFLQRVDVSSNQDALLGSDTSDKPRNSFENVKEHFRMIDLRVVAADGVGIIQSAMPSLIGTVLHKACFDGDRGNFEEIFTQSKGDIDAQVGIFGTALCVASFRGHASIVKRLLVEGAKPDDQEVLYVSALRVALMMGHKDVIQSLLVKKANPNTMDSWYGTPLQEASISGRSDIVELLLENAAKPNLRGGLFGSPLLASAWRGKVITVKSLLREGAFLDAQENGKTAKRHCI